MECSKLITKSIYNQKQKHVIFLEFSFHEKKIEQLNKSNNAENYLPGKDFRYKKPGAEQQTTVSAISRGNTNNIYNNES